MKKPYKCSAEQLVHLGPEMCAEIERSWLRRHKRDRLAFFVEYLPEIIVVCIYGALVVFAAIFAVIGGALLAA
jgi:hypothetical protein